MLALIKLFYKDPCDSCCDEIISESTITISTTAAPTSTSENTMSPTSSDNRGIQRKCESDNDCDEYLPYCDLKSGLCKGCNYRLEAPDPDDYKDNREEYNKLSSKYMSDLIKRCQRFPGLSFGCITDMRSPGNGICAKCDIPPSDNIFGTLECRNYQNPICKNYKCVPCSTNDDCNKINKKFCREDGSCNDGCINNKECPEGKPICDSSSGKCVNCLFNTDCKGNYKYCLTNENNPEGKCAECILGTDCKDIAKTQIYKCSKDGKCLDVECTTDQNCQVKGKDPSTPKCYLPLGKCSQCNSDSDCNKPWPAFCNNGVCTHNCRGADGNEKVPHDCIKEFPGSLSVFKYFPGEIKCKEFDKEKKESRCVYSPWGLF